MDGLAGERIAATIDRWLLPAPDANPALTEMLADRYRATNRNLVPWAGEFVGKYLLGSIGLWKLSNDDRLKQKIMQVIERTIALQGDDGYLGPFNKETRLREKWDVWGHYHLMLALLAWYHETSDERFLSATRRIADLLISYFVEGNRRMLTTDDPDGEKNYAIAHAALHLYRVTSEKRYLDFASWIEREWEEPPAGRYMSSALAGEPVWQFPSHRWESVHDWQAIAELALITGDDRYARAIEHIWWSILEGDRHNTGGFTSGEACQGDPYHQGAIETCCTVAWIALSIDMLRVTGDSRIADEIELSTLNGILGAQHPSGRWWTYNTPMDGEKRASQHDIVFQARAGSPEFNCCSANAPRGIGMISEWAVMQSDDGVTVNWYGPSTIDVLLRSGNRLRIVQDTAYPLDDSVTLRLELDKPENFCLRLRIPTWSNGTKVSVNGDAVDGVSSGTFLMLSREWCTGDAITIYFDFRPHVWVGDGACAGKASLYRGPILLAYDPRYDQHEPDELPIINLRTLTASVEKPSGWMAPWLLVTVDTGTGDKLTLCDFASAGATGTQYRTWLPATGMSPVGFSRDRSIWSRRP